MNPRKWCGLLLFAVSLCCAEPLTDLYEITDGVSGVQCKYDHFVLKPGEEKCIGSINGAGKITYFYFTDDSNGRIYDGLVLKIFWDDQAFPGVNVPLGAFFGVFNEQTCDYKSLPMEVNHLCYMSYLPMPFSAKARLYLVNDGDKTYDHLVAYGIDYVLEDTFREEKSRLYCQWVRSNPTQKGLHPVLKIQGRGHYVGNFLQVYSKYTGWWGEGDTVFSIDGKSMTHTPGTEDEYGSCWGFGSCFSMSYVGYIQNEKQQYRMYRWYLANPVRFQKSFTAVIQNRRFQGNDFKTGQLESGDDFISVAFWYQQDRAEQVLLEDYAKRTAPSRAQNY